MDINKKNVLIIGTSRLAYRVKKLVEESGHEVRCFDDVDKITKQKSPTLEKIAKALGEVDLNSISMIYLLDEKDEENLELIIALFSLNENLHITASMFNENITPHLEAMHPKLKILNPAKIAAPKFVEALDESLTRQLRYEPVKHTNKIPRSKSDMFIRKLILYFIAGAVSSVVYFHKAESMTWIDSCYFVVTTIATVGYGDISLIHASNLSKIIGIILMLGSTIFLWTIFSLIIDRMIKKRVQQSLGRKRYSLKNHVIVCGLGRLGYFIAEELLKRGEKIIIIEMNENSEHIDYFRRLGAEVYVGNARLPRVLKDANICEAKAVMSVINEDYINLEIGLNARSFKPDVRLILRIFDESMAEQIKEHLDIHLTLSMSAVADGKFFSELTPLESN